jgi:hypothetical protein
MPKKKTYKWYTVFGIYSDTMQRYTDTFHSMSAENAEKRAVAAAGPSLTVAGVIEFDTEADAMKIRVVA